MQVYEFINERFQTHFLSNEELPFSIGLKTIKKGTIVTAYGDIESLGYYLVSGIIQVEVLGEEDESDYKIVSFFFPNSFFNAYASFLTQKPSRVQIKAVTDCRLEYIRYDEIQKLYKTSILVNQIGRYITEKIYLEKTNREIDFLTKTATEKYKDLLNKNTNILKYIPLKDIAKYIGVSAETLSRIRKSLVS